MLMYGVAIRGIILNDFCEESVLDGETSVRVLMGVLRYFFWD